MAFDAGPPRIPPPTPFQREPIDWLDVVSRTIGVGLFLALYVGWIAYQFGGVLKALGIS